MTWMLGLARTVVAFGVATSIFATPGHAQTGQTQRSEASIGVTAGGYFEHYEGLSAAGVAGSVIVGSEITTRCGIRGELGLTSRLCDETGWCHRDRLVNLSVIRRMGSGQNRPFLVFGPLVPHVGVGVAVKFGRFDFSPELDIQTDLSSLALRPKVALTARL